MGGKRVGTGERLDRRVGTGERLGSRVGTGGRLGGRAGREAVLLVFQPFLEAGQFKDAVPARRLQKGYHLEQKEITDLTQENKCQKMY
jgi:hypothetical protein